MSLVNNLLRTSTVTEELSDAERGIVAGMFDVLIYKDGEIIVKPGDSRPDNLYILGSGAIEVKAASGEGETSIQMLKPGDLAGMITFVGGTSSQISATLYAVGDTQVLSMAKDKFERLLDTHPRIVYRVMRGVARSMHGIVRQGNAQTSALSNYIYGHNGRY